MKASFSIDFYFTNGETVYNNDIDRAYTDRKKFLSTLLYTIWEINHDLADGSFPLEKIEIKQDECYVYVPLVEMSMPKEVMDSFIN